MSSEPIFMVIPGVLITVITAIPLWYFYIRSDRQIYKARSPLLSINCLVFELICFWIILASSVVNYNEEIPTQMNVTQWQCPNDNTVINLNRKVTLNTIFIAIFTASKNSQILLFIARCFRITCAYNIKWERCRKLTSFFIKQGNILAVIYILWIGVFFIIYYYPYLSPFSFWMIDIYKTDLTRYIFSSIFTIYFTLCVIVLLFCLQLIDITDQRFKIKYDIQIIISCFIFTNLFFFATQSIQCSNETQYYFLGINPYFWIVIVLDLWVVLATGYIVIYFDMKQQGESYVLFHETLIENIQNFMLHKDQYDYKQIFLLFLNYLADGNKKSFFGSQISENHLKKSMIIYDLYVDIILIEININDYNSELGSIQAQNNNNNTETQISSQFQSIVNDYFTPTDKDTYLGTLYGIDQQCRINVDFLQQSEANSVQIQNQLINVIITKTKFYMNEFFNEFKKTHSFHFIKIMMANNSTVCQRLASFNLIHFNNQ
ncbi:hypothetical protein ABPG72_004953 [Tetrahymena utriculariae]